MRKITKQIVFKTEFVPLVPIVPNVPKIFCVGHKGQGTIIIQ
jgi:hypothetical protein